MQLENLRDRIETADRLDAEWLHLFALEAMVEALRSEPEYAANGRSGLTLVKTPQLRIVLEAVRAGDRIEEHTVSGPTVVQVLQGALHLASGDETRTAHAGEMMVVPPDRERSIRAKDASAFLWILSPDEDTRAASR